MKYLAYIWNIFKKKIITIDLIISMYFFFISNRNAKHIKKKS